MNIRLLASPILAAGVLVACTNIDSDDIDTDAIQPNVNVRSNNGADGSSVNVTLHVGDSPTTFVELQGGDELTATGGGATRTLESNELLGVVSYTGDLPTKTPGDVITIAFTRTEEGKASAPDSNVALTEGLTLTAPLGAAVASRAAALVVSWDSVASEDQVRVGWSGGCVVDGSRDVTAGQNTLTLEAGTISKREQGENEADPPPDNCDVQLTVSRSRTGTIDAAFGGGSITHTFSDSVTFESQP